MFLTTPLVVVALFVNSTQQLPVEVKDHTASLIKIIVHFESCLLMINNKDILQSSTTQWDFITQIIVFRLENKIISESYSNKLIWGTIRAQSIALLLPSHALFCLLGASYYFCIGSI